jgi:NADH-quinone oxidoreductase subunit M
VLAALFLIITLANLAMPGTSNFIGEFYILIGVFQSKIVYAFVASIGVALAAYYAIRLFQGTMHHRATENADSREIGLRDALVLAPLTACIVALALYPGLILGRSDTSVKATIAQTCLGGTYVNGSAGAPPGAGVSVNDCPGDPFSKTSPPPPEAFAHPTINVIK